FAFAGGQVHSVDGLDAAVALAQRAQGQHGHVEIPLCAGRGGRRDAKNPPASIAFARNRAMPAPCRGQSLPPTTPRLRHLAKSAPLCLSSSLTACSSGFVPPATSSIVGARTWVR